MIPQTDFILVRGPRTDSTDNRQKPPTALRSKTWDKLGTHDLVGGFAKRRATSDKKRGGFTRATITANVGGADEL